VKIYLSHLGFQIFRNIFHQILNFPTLEIFKKLNFKIFYLQGATENFQDHLNHPKCFHD
jgi:hypothetical protein